MKQASLKNLAARGIIGEISPDLQEVARQFSVAITPLMADLIHPRDPADPIAAQFIPSLRELDVCAGDLSDPIGDHAHTVVPGLIHRYPDRVLLQLSGACPVHCRFCFRREHVATADAVLSDDQQSQALDYIRTQETIWEVVISGGDPLSLSDQRLSQVFDQLATIEHLKVIRVHTRIPVVDPQRITDQLVRILKNKKAVYVLLHCNHPREFTNAARHACAKIVDAGIPLLSQSVLLRGVNDRADVLEDLMRTFVENRIKPHYLHHGDRARGTAHFRVPLEKAQDLLRSLRGTVSGLCQPTYMLDLPGGHGKVPVGPVYARRSADGPWIVEDIAGKEHLYPDDLSSPEENR